MGVEKTKWITLGVCERNLVKSTQSKTADVVIIGHDDGHTFRDVLQMLHRNNQSRVVSEFRTLLGALEAGLGQAMSADFVIVLQSYSNEFSQQEINELIGRCLFGRILCCYGPWCTSDGRSHELWPVAFRIPATSATSIVELELLGFQTNTQALFPMSAGEEVFAHRSQFPNTIEPTVHSKAIVISDDSELRATVAGILTAMNCDCTKLPLAVSTIRSHLASQNKIPLLAIIDLDAANGIVPECLDVLHAAPGMTTLIGMSGFFTSLKYSGTQGEHRSLQILEKTELLLQLRQLINCS